MTTPDTDPDALVSEGRVVYQCAECGEVFKRGRGLLHVTCPACRTDAVSVVAHV